MKYSGKDFLLQILDGSTWISSLSDRSTSISIGNEQVDTTSKDATPWRELGAFGIRSAEISASGIVSDRAVFGLFMAAAFNGDIIRARVIHGPDAYVIIECDYTVSSCERSGEYNGAEQYSLSLASAGTIIPQETAITTESGLLLTTEDGLLLAIG